MPDVSFKNEDGSARNTPRVLEPSSNTDVNVGAIAHPEEVVDVSAIRKIEQEAAAAIEKLLHPLVPIRTGADFLGNGAISQENVLENNTNPTIPEPTATPGE